MRVALKAGRESGRADAVGRVVVAAWMVVLFVVLPLVLG